MRSTHGAGSVKYEVCFKYFKQKVTKHSTAVLRPPLPLFPTGTASPFFIPLYLLCPFACPFSPHQGFSGAVDSWNHDSPIYLCFPGVPWHREYSIHLYLSCCFPWRVSSLPSRVSPVRSIPGTASPCGPSSTRLTPSPPSFAISFPSGPRFGRGSTSISKRCLFLRASTCLPAALQLSRCPIVAADRVCGVLED